MKPEAKKVAYIEPDDYFPKEILPEDGTIVDCGGNQPIFIPVVEGDKDPSKPISKQKTIHEKWEVGEITILPTEKC